MHTHKNSHMKQDSPQLIERFVGLYLSLRFQVDYFSSWGTVKGLPRHFPALGGVCMASLTRPSQAHLH